MNGVLLRPLPGYETGRLIRLGNASRDGLGYFPPDLYLRLRDPCIPSRP